MDSTWTLRSLNTGFLIDDFMTSNIGMYWFCALQCFYNVSFNPSILAVTVGISSCVSPVSAVYNVSEVMQMVFCVVKTAKQPKIAGTATCSPTVS